MFAIKLDRVSESAQKIDDIVRRLENINAELYSIENGLNECLKTEAMTEISETLHKIKGNIKLHTNQSKQMSNGLKTVVSQYAEAERRIVSEAEEIALLHKRTSAQYSDFSWYGSKLSGIKFR